jgi:hypothetical protein
MRVEVRRMVVGVVERDHDPEELADPWHAAPRCTTAAAAGFAEIR